MWNEIQDTVDHSRAHHTYTRVLQHDPECRLKTRCRYAASAGSPLVKKKQYRNDLTSIVLVLLTSLRRFATRLTNCTNQLSIFRLHDESSLQAFREHREHVQTVLQVCSTFHATLVGKDPR